MTAPYSWWYQDSPIGELVVYASDAGVCCIEIDDARGDRSERSERRERGRAARELDEYFAGERTRFTVPVDLDGVTAPFRRRVLETLRDDVAFGETVAYGELAVMAGRPGAARAVGSAMATCPVPILIPCHRVLAAGGAIGGYGGRLDQKRALLAIEGVEVR